jgi:large subunit ribosomal protein L9
MPSSVKVVFRSDVRGIAQAGEVKNVSSGYARNFLFPRNLAFAASDATLRQWETERQGTLAKATRRREEDQTLAQKIESITCVISAKAGPEGRLFGSVSRQEIIDALAKEGVKVSKHAVALSEPLKQAGPAVVPIRLGSHLQASLKVTIVTEI